MTGPHRRVWLVVASIVATAPLATRSHAANGEADWIWSPAHAKNEAPIGDCYFRRSFDLKDVEEAQVHITADNQWELFVNGQPVAKGVDWRQMQIHDVTKLLHNGRNTVAIRVANTEPGAAGLAARVIVKQTGGTFEGFSTDGTWKTSVRQFQGWTLPQFNDADWVAAAVYGELGDTLPWGNEVVIDGEGARFIVPREFEVERIMRDEAVGSLIAMAFDARGNIIVSREGGHLMLLTDADGNGIHDTATSYCEQIQNAQGILALGTRVFVVGDGPQGPALYRLRDADRNGSIEEVTRLIGFRGSKGEHGPHAVRLGPDGLLYVLAGNFARADAQPDSRSPYRNWYEGDLVPKFEDPGGHAVGIPAPGGTVFRTDANGSFVELVAGGLRNAYDLAFSPEGELFTYDADMEWDRGAPWYRPTRVNHLTDGAELGWRSGWSKWPEYYIDSLPAALDVGPGSPTGVEFYNHVAFPQRYRGAMFACDWATGKIHAVTFERTGASFRGRDEVFLEGRPLNATDVAVGPDGALYFCTGGRGTDGGVYRIRYSGAPMAEATDAVSALDQALQQPQVEADWARARVAAAKQRLGARWESELSAAARDLRRPPRERIQALDLLVYFGPRPGDPLLTALAADPEPTLRARAARLMYQSDAPAIRTTLIKLLNDRDALVRRSACESLMRRGPLPSAEDVVPLLADDDRFAAFAARRLLEQLPVESWAPAVLAETRPLAFARGGVTLAAAAHEASTSVALVTRAQGMLQQNLTDDQRLHLLRVIQTAIAHGALKPDAVATLPAQLLAMYPTTDALANRELVRLLVALQAAGAAEKFAAELGKPEVADAEKLHIAAYAARLDAGWSASSKLAMLRFYELARTVQAGYSVEKYVEQFTREFLKKLSLDERRNLLAGGEKWPATALSTLASLPERPGAALLRTIRELDAKVAPKCADNDAFRRLRVGIIAVLGGADDPDSQQHLRRIYAGEPEYRDPAAMSLAQHPASENWKYLVDALRTAEGVAAQDILVALTKVNQRPSDAASQRHAIVAGLRLRDNGASDAVRLLAHWNGPLAAAGASSDWKVQLSAWQAWYAEKYPDDPPAELPADAGKDKWSYDELLTYLESPAGKQGDASRGEQVFTQAQCASCHRVGTHGEGVGPDLTAVARRFQRKEILSAIVYPSHDISDQYASRVVMSGGKAYAGMVTPRGPQGVTILLATGQKVDLAHEAIDEIQPSNISAMPTGLLNPLTLDQVADLFAYLATASATDVAKAPLAPARR
ncbi:MAG: HEAT repeat domain-containing protein [Pirellulales bacterium]|nr:HEAT repeat domain-containing protein [Pirellulales bacterium]